MRGSGMNRIIENVRRSHLQRLREGAKGSGGLDIATGYMSLSGWGSVGQHIDDWQGDGREARILIGMVNPEELGGPEGGTIRRKRREAIKKALRRQLHPNTPTGQARAALQMLVRQLNQSTVRVGITGKRMHAKAYLFLEGKEQAASACVGSANLTASGMEGQGELSLLEHDPETVEEIAAWLERYWGHRQTKDISQELAEWLKECWIEACNPYEVYLAMARTIGEDNLDAQAVEGIPRSLERQLLSYQIHAVKHGCAIARREGGVLLADVVGMGKTLMALGVAMGLDRKQRGTLVVCPASLTDMWADETKRTGIARPEVLSMDMLARNPEEGGNPAVVIVDESHNAKTTTSQRHKALAELIERSGAYTVLCTATPYGVGVKDIGGQLKLFIDPEQPLRIACGQGNTLEDYEQSGSDREWQALLGMYMVRRSRSLVRQVYAEVDEDKRSFLRSGDGAKRYLPKQRVLKEQYTDSPQITRLLEGKVGDAIGGLRLPRQTIDEGEMKARGLTGLARTSLVKQLESSGPAFIAAVERHLKRDALFEHALEEGKERIPRGDGVAECTKAGVDNDEWYDEWLATASRKGSTARPSAGAAKMLVDQARSDGVVLRGLLEQMGTWTPATDGKAQRLAELVLEQYGEEKVVVFTEYRATAHYLAEVLRGKDPSVKMEVVDGDHKKPTEAAKRFSPRSSKAEGKYRKNETRVLISTDRLSEGQNLQDARVVVCYDMPWSIVKMEQRMGRVDRIGQEAEEVYAHLFEPTAGIEVILRLMERVRARNEQQEVLLEAGDAGEITVEQATSEARRIFAAAGQEKMARGDEDWDGTDDASWGLAIYSSATAENEGLKRRVEKLALREPAIGVRTAQAGERAGTASMLIRLGNGIIAGGVVDFDGNVRHAHAGKGHPGGGLRSTDGGEQSPDRMGRHSEQSGGGNSGTKRRNQTRNGPGERDTPEDVQGSQPDGRGREWCLGRGHGRSSSSPASRHSPTEIEEVLGRKTGGT